MNIQRTQKRIVLFVLLPALSCYLGLRLFAQYRHVDVYVTRQSPMPAALSLPLDFWIFRRVICASKTRPDGGYTGISF
jgi:hypothetical protein